MTMRFNPREITLADLDDKRSQPDREPDRQDYPLPTWYRSICHKPLSNLGVEDICRACRQRIHPEYIVPLAIQMLQSDPIAGEMYEGELLMSLANIPGEYWLSHSDDRNKVDVILTEADALKEADIDDEVAALRARIHGT